LRGLAVMGSGFRVKENRVQGLRSGACVVVYTSDMGFRGESLGVRV